MPLCLSQIRGGGGWGAFSMLESTLLISALAEGGEGGYYQNRNPSYFDASKVKMTFNKNVYVMPDLANLIRIDQL